MTTIIENKDYTISQNDGIFYIHFSSKSEQLIQSFSKQLVGATVFADYKTVSFRANSVTTYTHFRDVLRVEHGVKRMNYELTLSMVTDLTKQIVELIAQKKCFYTFDLDNLIVIDNGAMFVYISNEHLLDVIPRRGTMLFIKPFLKTIRFISPEMSSIIVLPSEINYKSIYYSLGMLALYCLYDDELDDEMKSSSIQGTKLFWLLKRCLDKDPNKRSILFV